MTNNTIKSKIMKLKGTFLFLFLMSFTLGNAQNEACMTNLSLMSEAAKAKSYDTAYPYFMTLRNECPKYNRAIYVYGEKILDHKIDKAQGEEKKAFIADLEKMYNERMNYFASKTPKGEYLGKIAQLKYDNRELLGLDNETLYNEFDNAYTTDSKSFDSPKSLYVYFKLMVDLFDAGKKPAVELFNKYDDVNDRIETALEENAAKANKLVAKVEAGGTLTSKEKRLEK